MRFLHTMVRVRDLDESLRFYCDLLGLKEVRRKEVEAGRFTLVFLRDPAVVDDDNAPEIELTWNWDTETYAAEGRAWGHMAFRVDDIYATCQRLMDSGVTINRPPRDGHMAFVKSPDGVSIELLQAGEAKAPEAPWTDMPNIGSW